MISSSQKTGFEGEHIRTVREGQCQYYRYKDEILTPKPTGLAIPSHLFK